MGRGPCPNYPDYRGSFVRVIPILKILLQLNSGKFLG